jgi:hypothetical protein
MRTLEEMRNILEIDPMNPDVDFALWPVPLKIIPLHCSSNYPIASLITTCRRVPEAGAAELKYKCIYNIVDVKDTAPRPGNASLWITGTSGPASALRHSPYIQSGYA